MSFSRRRPSPLQTQHSRDPHRHRWERRHPPYYHDKVVIGLALLLLSCLSICWTWPFAVVIDTQNIAPQQAPAIQKRPLRGRWTAPRNNHHKAKQEAPIAIAASFFEQPPIADAVVGGSGLAGMTAMRRILDRGGKVAIVEKEQFLGGNSNKASSGINGCCLEAGNSSGIVSTFNSITNDTLGLLPCRVYIYHRSCIFI
jgi:hypothetical protein